MVQHKYPSKMRAGNGPFHPKIFGSSPHAPKLGWFIRGAMLSIPGKCNSSESGIGRTSAVTRFQDGASRLGCCDMVGNVWEFVLANDAERDWCVLRGGSYKNNRFEVRSYLRLIRVPKNTARRILVSVLHK